MEKLLVITKYLTFPGALVRGFWEHLVCKICGIPVEDNRLLMGDELCGHTEHELAPTARKAFALCFVPAFLNGLLGFILAVSSMLLIFAFEMSGVITTVAGVLAFWFAVSLAVNSYPLVEDAMNMKDKIYRHGNIAQKIFYSIGFAFLYVGAYLEKYLITFVLAVAGTVALCLMQ